MKNKIFTFSLIVLITLLMIVPAYASNENEYVILAGEYIFNEHIDQYLQVDTTTEQFQASDQYFSFNHSVYVNGVLKNFSRVRCFLWDGTMDDTLGSTYVCDAHCRLTADNGSMMSGADYYYDGSYIQIYNGVEYPYTLTNGWRIDDRKVIVNDDQVVDEKFYNWFTNVTNYNIVNAPKRTISAGMYTFNETPVLPGEDMYIHFATPALIMYKDDIGTTVYECQRMMINTETLVYNVIQPSTQSITVYTEPPFVNAGWLNDQYRLITIVNDIEVSQTVYDWFIANTTPPPEYKGTYIFHEDGITYEPADGMGPFPLIGTYESDDTTRIDVQNKICAMYKDANGVLYIVASDKDFRNLSDSVIVNNPQTSFDLWKVENEVITYQGLINQFTPFEWVAGNKSILNYSDDGTYHAFDTGMSFQKPPFILQQIVGKGMMLEVMTELVVLLPCCVILLTAYLGLRKALQICQTILHKA